MWPNPQETVDLVTYAEEISNEKLFVKCQLLQGLPSWFLAPQKSPEQKNEITTDLGNSLSENRSTVLSNTKGYLPLKYDQGRNHSIQKAF